MHTWVGQIFENVCTWVGQFCENLCRWVAEGKIYTSNYLGEMDQIYKNFACSAKKCSMGGLENIIVRAYIGGSQKKMCVHGWVKKRKCAYMSGFESKVCSMGGWVYKSSGSSCVST